MTPVLPQRRSLRCLLGFHRWVALNNDTGERYSVCYRCGKDDPYMPTLFGPGGAYR